VRACFARGNLNLKGFPLLPKKFCEHPLHNRGAFNTFLTWIKLLQFEHINWVIDVGANHGDFSEAVTALFPKTNVLLVEPLTQLHPELESRCSNKNGRWLLERAAIGASESVMPIYIANENDAIGSLAGFSNDYRAANPEMNSVREELCTVTTLDKLVASHQIQTVDLLKIDVEGFEFEVLRGATLTLPKTRAVIIEVSFIRKATNVENPLLELLTQLTKHGFDVVEIIPSLYDPKDTWKPLEFNVVARRRT